MREVSPPTFFALLSVETSEQKKWWKRKVKKRVTLYWGFVPMHLTFSEDHEATMGKFENTSVTISFFLFQEYFSPPSPPMELNVAGSSPTAAASPYHNPSYSSTLDHQSYPLMQPHQQHYYHPQEGLPGVRNEFFKCWKQFLSQSITHWSGFPRISPPSLARPSFTQLCVWIGHGRIELD